MGAGGSMTKLDWMQKFYAWNIYIAQDGSREQGNGLDLSHSFTEALLSEK